jgi:hypothetical protein
MRLIGLLLVAGCALLRSGDPDALQAATDTGLDAGTLTCTVVVGEAPELVPQVRAAVARGQAVLAAEDVTGRALVEALMAIDDLKWRTYAQAGLRLALRRIAGTGQLDVSVAKDSPVAVGASAFFEACASMLGDVAV